MAIKQLAVSETDYAPIKLLMGEQLKHFKLLVQTIKALNVSTTYNDIASDFLKGAKYPDHKEMMRDANTLFSYFGAGDLRKNIIKPILDDLKDLG